MNRLQAFEPIITLIVLMMFPAILLWPVPVSHLPTHTFRVDNKFPSDPEAFTQGLVIDKGKLYMGTGLNGYSSLRQVNLATGQVLKQINLDHDDFGEGITVVDDKIIQLTWKSNIGFIYNTSNFVEINKFSCNIEGWGLTFDGKKLIVSDGTDVLYFWDKETLKEIGQVKVYDDNGPVYYLNELEYINGLVYANIWKTDRIARINPTTGAVVDWIDLSGLLDKEKYPSSNVLNGIAYDGKKLYVTGKRWPFIYQIEVLDEQ